MAAENLLKFFEKNFVEILKKPKFVAQHCLVWISIQMGVNPYQDLFHHVLAGMRTMWYHETHIHAVVVVNDRLGIGNDVLVHNPQLPVDVCSENNLLLCLTEVDSFCPVFLPRIVGITYS